MWTESILNTCASLGRPDLIPFYSFIWGKFPTLGRHQRTNSWLQIRPSQPFCFLGQHTSTWPTLKSFQQFPTASIIKFKLFHRTLKTLHNLLSSCTCCLTPTVTSMDALLSRHKALSLSYESRAQLPHIYSCHVFTLNLKLHYFNQLPTLPSFKVLLPFLQTPSVMSSLMTKISLVLLIRLSCILAVVHIAYLAH